MRAQSAAESCEQTGAHGKAGAQEHANATQGRVILVSGDGILGIMERSLSTLLRTLATLRWMAVIGQSATIAVAAGLLGVALPALALWSDVALLAAFNMQGDA